MKLYELTQTCRQLDTLLEEGGDDETFWLALGQIEDGIKVKANNLAKLIQNVEATAEAIKAHEQRMAARRQTMERQAGAMRAYLLDNMVAADILSIECEAFKLSVTNNPPSVLIEDEKAIPVEYMRQAPPPPPVPDKKKIMDDLKVGVVIDGVSLNKGSDLLSNKLTNRH